MFKNVFPRASSCRTARDGGAEADIDETRPKTRLTVGLRDLAVTVEA